MEEFQTHYEYVPALDMQCITKYLTQEKVEFVSCIKELEEFMDLMFSRIKWFIFVFLFFALGFLDCESERNDKIVKNDILIRIY